MKTAIEFVSEEYTKRGASFEDTLKWHMNNGWVISIPYIFAMGYFYNDGEKTVCFMTYCNGNIIDVLKFANFKIDFLEFQRDFSGKTKRYDYQRFVSKL